MSPANITNTSGTYNFAPSLGETVLYSYGLCGIRSTALTQQHFETARMATNLMMSAWSARGINLWSVDLQSFNLVQGCSTYQVPSNTIVMLDMYVTQATGIDRIVNPISRTEYASFTNKQQQGSPTSAWFDRLLSPTVTLWPVPDGTVSAFNYYRLRQSQDSQYSNGTSIEIPIYFWDCFALGLAWRLALSWAPPSAPMLKSLADEAYNFAATQNVETSNVYVAPMVGGYFR
jgi:hypothetical protein